MSITDERVASSCSTPAPAPPPSPPPVNVRASVFFDGTGNNRTNTQQRIDQTWTYRLLPGVIAGSYENDFTNVSKLERYVLPDATVDHSFSLYVEGIGTQSGADDVIEGMAFGTGITGVDAKVESAISQIVRNIRRRVRTNVVINNLYLDAFGFSRGAAAARFFFYETMDARTKIQVRLQNLGYTVNNVTAKFAGLFDTVASYGLSHTDDTADLHLDAVHHAEKVIHLAAADEHRKNFPLTNINSCSGVGTQWFLPGVHSDIGGGYRTYDTEEDLQILDFDDTSGIPVVREMIARKFRQEKARLIDEGWYQESNFSTDTSWNELKVTREGISNKYSRIPLHIMAIKAQEKGLTFSGDLLSRETIDPRLAAVKTEIDQYIAAHSGVSSSQPSHWLDSRPTLQNLRRRFLHYSSFYGSAGGSNEPNFVPDNPMTGVRTRVIHNG